MTFDNPSVPEPTSVPPGDADLGPWYKELNRYHWFVLVVSALGWLFDCLDQQLFNLARAPAIRELMGPEYVAQYGGIATSVFIIGWASGGLIFGTLGDKIGRAKTMVLTILIYSLCTGLSSFSQYFWDFALYRFLTGLGVGGEFAVGVALVAEVMPDRARPHALGWLQALSAVGNITAAFIGIGLGSLESADALAGFAPWRIMFIIGALPALLALVIRRRLKEPERWQTLRANQAAGGQKLGSFAELFGNPTLRRNALVGLMLAIAGVIGLWAIVFFSFELVRASFREAFEAEMRSKTVLAQEYDLVRGALKDRAIITGTAKSIQADDLLDVNARLLYGVLAKDTSSNNQPAEITKSAVARASERGITADASKLQAILEGPRESKEDLPTIVQNVADRSKDLSGQLTYWSGVNGLMLNIGAFIGIYLFSKITQRIGRKPTFALAFLLAMLCTSGTFWFLSQPSDVFWMVPIMGACQFSLFGGYAIYFPELFPTRLRSTGISFCYNVGRYVAAVGPVLLGILTADVFGSFGPVLSLRYAGVTMCSIFFLGLLALPFAPETKGKPLPE